MASVYSQAPSLTNLPPAGLSRATTLTTLSTAVTSEAAALTLFPPASLSQAHASLSGAPAVLSEAPATSKLVDCQCNTLKMISLEFQVNITLLTTKLI